jgi:hypothetical protein
VCVCRLRRRVCFKTTKNQVHRCVHRCACIRQVVDAAAAAEERLQCRPRCPGPRCLARLGGCPAPRRSLLRSPPQAAHASPSSPASRSYARRAPVPLVRPNHRPPPAELQRLSKLSGAGHQQCFRGAWRCSRLSSYSSARLARCSRQGANLLHSIRAPATRSMVALWQSKARGHPHLHWSQNSTTALYPHHSYPQAARGPWVSTLSGASGMYRVLRTVASSLQRGSCSRSPSACLLSSWLALSSHGRRR